MRTISFEKMFEILNDCVGMVWDDNYLSYVSINNDPKAIEEGEAFLTLECTDDKSLELVSVQFRKKDNLQVTVVGHSIWLKATDGEDCQLVPLFSKDLSEYQ